MSTQLEIQSRVPRKQLESLLPPSFRPKILNVSWIVRIFGIESIDFVLSSGIQLERKKPEKAVSMTCLDIQFFIS